MTQGITHLRRPRCILVYALAPEGMAPAQANRIFNDFVADTTLPLAIFHDHFIGAAGGVAIYFAERAEEREALQNQNHLAGWQVEYRPLVFSHSPAAFDEQTAFTLKAYRSSDWERIQREKRPRYGSATREAETAEEDAGGNELT
ncbi:MAG TPA: hypothetical protein VIU38_05775 [Anaerolineales bacterium]